VRKLVAFIVIAALANVATVAALPWLINAFVVHRLVERSGGYNRAIAWPRADAGARTIVRPSPDLLYTSCAFDVSEQPLRITAPVPDSYVSISGFAANTDNFFALNDADVPAGAEGRRQLDVILARPGATNLPAGARVVTAPTDKGLILFRSLITRDADLPRLQELQAQQRCEPLAD
jgi:uncharacterized membrane protein